MTQVNSLTIDEIINELDLGRATVKFILSRFSAVLPHDRIDGRVCYNQKALSTLIQIKDLMDQGLMPSQIETALAETPAPVENQVQDVRMSRDALTFIQNLFQDIKIHQNRIARAHEKRAEAEERKAVAIEKRAEAEEKKAQAMNNIATALQEMSRQRPGDPQTMEIAGHAAQALTLTETNDPFDTPIDTDDAPIDLEDTIDLDVGLDDADLNDLFSPPGTGMELKGDTGFDSDAFDDLESDDLGLEDLARELAEPEESPDSPPIDDLNLLVDQLSTQPEVDLDGLLEDPGPLPDLDALVDTDPTIEDLDDLNSLVEMHDITEDLDDLSLLVDGAPQPRLHETSQDLDDLFCLVDADDTLDDLSLLVDAQDPSSPQSSTVQQDLDDLSLLVDMPQQAGSADMDDLSALIDNPSADLDDLSLLVDVTPTQQEDLDDLYALVDSETSEQSTTSPAAPAKEAVLPEPSLKPDITPEKDMAKYKAAVMKIIIDLKNSGLSAGETTERLNRDEVPTLSGKPLWREKAIAKIYGFIESAQ